MTIKLYGASGATCTKRVATVATELGVKYELVAVDVMAGAHKQSEYTAFQPFGQIPYLASLFLRPGSSR
jgi:glutathione S-transferase